ncbi:Protein SRG1 [Triticum urartu]|uniref:Protein SRG1 n=1 Tax=Triticum urartu TaxID=4572 RepID=M7ZR02_TRIUA|nr:Protein SRG1 [Triticum urartu]
MESTGGARPTSPVQELAGAHGKLDVPARYVSRSHHENGQHPTAAPVPVIDIGRLFKQEGAAAADGEEAKLRQALESWGLFLGYGTDRVSSAEQILDWSDRLYLRVEPEDERSLALWPAHPQTFRNLLHEFTTKCRVVKDGLVQAMARLLGLDDDYIMDQFGEKADTYARFSYYPECPRPELVFGLKPHSDGSVLTVLMVDDTIGGLQILRDGVWFDVPIVPHTLLINIGDQTEELAGALAAPVVPARYVARGQHDHDQQPATAVVAPIPVIDLGRLFKLDDTTASAEEAAKLRLALESWGLFLVTNHGVDAAVMDGMMAASREFFQRPPEEKQRYTNLIGGERFQLEGYGTDQVSSPDQILDWSDRLFLKVEPEDERSLALWPAHPETFR